MVSLDFTDQLAWRYPCDSVVGFVNECADVELALENEIVPLENY